MHRYHAFLCYWDRYLLKKSIEPYSAQMVPLAHGLPRPKYIWAAAVSWDIMVDETLKHEEISNSFL